VSFFFGVAPYQPTEPYELKSMGFHSHAIMEPTAKYEGNSQLHGWFE
jgi:hypothetical protein